MNEDSERDARRGPRGATGPAGERGEAGMDRKTRRAIVYLFVLAMLLAATSILFTVGYVGWQSSRQQAVQERAQAAAARTEAKAVVLCGALLRLSQIKGTHGDSGATYGANLEKAFEQVYAATDCSKIMKTGR